MLERAGIGAGASGVQPGGVRQQWGTRVACRLAVESVAFWREADMHLSPRVPLTLRRGGYLFAAHSTGTLERLEANVRLQNEEGVPSRIVSAAEAAELVPGLRVDELAGAAWCAEDGYFDRPQSVVEAFARDADVRIVDVRTIEQTPTGWRVEGVDADAVVIAAGTESRTLLAPFGIDLPVVGRGSLPLPQRSDRGAPARAARRRARARLRGQAARRRACARQRPFRARRRRRKPGAVARQRSAPASSSCCPASSTSRSRSSCTASTTSRPTTSRSSVPLPTGSSSPAASAGTGS